MIRWFSIAIVFLLLVVDVSAQTIRVRSSGNGKAKINRGKLFSVVDLRKEIAGCLLLFDGSEPNPKKFDVTKFKLVDSVATTKNVYVLLLATAGSNCNVQSYCGAAENLTLISLKLDRTLKLEDKKAVVIQDCIEDIGLNSPDVDSENRNFVLKLKDGELKLELGENLYRSEEDYKVTRVTYSHAKPENGLVVTTEKRPRLNK